MPRRLSEADRHFRVKSAAKSAAALIPPSPTLPSLKRSAKSCKACDLWKLGTQTVFGQGPASARVMFVGEQPGDSEDKIGHPFVGPAGRLLDEVLAEVGIDRSDVYVTNVVKHFKWVAAQRGKRRIHKKPRHSEIEACRPWLDAELQIVRPEVLVCLGASAAQALLSKDFRVTRDRGSLIKSDLALHVMATTHPASILRAPDPEARQQQRREFVRDLAKVAELIRGRRKVAQAKFRQPSFRKISLTSEEKLDAENKEVFRSQIQQGSRQDRGQRDAPQEAWDAEVRTRR